uniref:Wsv192-like protein n=1 Tax=Metopaulias depressus WSSV-like virus TaxID=1675544 RepID=A0A0K0VL82_9VIRU|nr:wsv192-like protein [Metopaulias depressus WSSV-like virus]
MNNANNHTTAAAAVTSGVTWEIVDRVVEHELKTQKCVMLLKTSSRRLFAFVAVYSFLHRQLTNRSSRDSEEWCSASATRNLLRGVAKIIRVLESRVRYFRARLDELYMKRVRENHDAIDLHIVMSRHTEITDPDKKIWKRMHESNIAPEKVVKAYEKVKHLLPNEAVANYEPRTGAVVRQEKREQKQLKTVNANTAVDYTNISSADFYERYIKSDIVVAKSNRLSKMFNENFDIFPGTSIRVPRRIERYFNIEIASAIKNNIRFPSNYIRGMVLAYSLGEMFGGAFSAMQIYIMGFSNSASVACGNRVLETSFSKLKAFLKSNKLFNISSCQRNDNNNNTPPPPSTFAGAFLVPITKNQDARKIIFDSVNYIPDRKEKAAVAVMKSTVAEHEPDGYMAVWLALAISRLLGRKVTPGYAILFLVNWAAKQYQEDNSDHPAEDYLKRLSTSIGITFDQKYGLVVPVVEFGSGLTNIKLRNYAVHAINQFVRKLLKSGTITPDRERENFSKLTLEQLSARLFKNNDVIKNSATGGEDDAEREALSSMKGEEFVPNEERRQIHEEEYNKALNPRLKLRFRFGVCGYQHPLSTSSNKQTLVTQQLLKHRQIYAQRETAAATNWDRLLQFLFPRNTALSQPEVVGPYTSFAVSRLLNLNRSFVEIAQTALKNVIPCERVLEDINIKFNADILTLGNKPDSFLRTKAGLVIGEHARQALEIANRTLCRYEECRRVSKLHPSEISFDSEVGKLAVDLAHGCVIARKHQHQYSELQPFILPLHTTNSTTEDDNKRFQPIPLYGIEDPIFPKKNSYVDETATKCNDYESKFWLDENNENMVDALRSRGILSLPVLLKNRNLNILKSNNKCIKFFKDIRTMNHKDLASDKPRKYDPAPWSSKNTGQTGRSSTEFSPNSVIVLSLDDVDEEENYSYREEDVRGVNGETFTVGGIDNVFLAAVETQRNMAQNNIVYPYCIKKEDGGYMIQAPDVSPVYRHGGKPAVITLKHSVKNINKKQL